MCVSYLHSAMPVINPKIPFVHFQLRIIQSDADTDSCFSLKTPTHLWRQLTPPARPTSNTPERAQFSSYIQRRLIKSMEGLSLKYDGSIRNSNGEMTQLLYGEDGMDASWLEFGGIDTIKPSHEVRTPWLFVMGRFFVLFCFCFVCKVAFG